MKTADKALSCDKFTKKKRKQPKKVISKHKYMTFQYISRDRNVSLFMFAKTNNQETTTQIHSKKKYNNFTNSRGKKFLQQTYILTHILTDF